MNTRPPGCPEATFFLNIPGTEDHPPLTTPFDPNELDAAIPDPDLQSRALVRLLSSRGESAPPVLRREAAVEPDPSEQARDRARRWLRTVGGNLRRDRDTVNRNYRAHIVLLDAPDEPGCLLRRFPGGDSPATRLDQLEMLHRALAGDPDVPGRWRGLREGVAKYAVALELAVPFAQEHPGHAIWAARRRGDSWSVLNRDLGARSTTNGGQARRLHDKFVRAEMKRRRPVLVSSDWHGAVPGQGLDARLRSGAFDVVLAGDLIHCPKGIGGEELDRRNAAVVAYLQSLPGEAELLFGNHELRLLDQEALRHTRTAGFVRTSFKRDHVERVVGSTPVFIAHARYCQTGDAAVLVRGKAPDPPPVGARHLAGITRPVGELGRWPDRAALPRRARWARRPGLPSGLVVVGHVALSDGPVVVENGDTKVIFVDSDAKRTRQVRALALFPRPEGLKLRVVE